MKGAREATLNLHRTPLIESAVPAYRHQTGGTGHGARIPCAIRQITGKNLALIRSHQHIIIGRFLREDRHLPLNLDNAGVGATRSARIGKFALGHNFCTKAQRRMTQSLTKQFVLRVGAGDQQPLAPFFPYQILRQPVGQLRAAGRHMNKIGAAILLTQPLVRRAGIEHNLPIRLAQIGSLEQGLGLKIGNDKANLLTGQRGHGRGHILKRFHRSVDQHEPLVLELPGGVGVIYCELEASQPVIVGGHVQQGEAQFGMGCMNITDADFADGRGNVLRTQHGHRAKDHSHNKRRTTYRQKAKSAAHRPCLILSIPDRPHITLVSRLLWPEASAWPPA